MIDSLGFSGTQRGMTEEQKQHVIDTLILLKPKHVHHGDCVGADEDFHVICRLLEHSPIIHIHPPSNPKKRAYCAGDVNYAEAAYLKRNRNIVSMIDALIAAPDGPETVRSGTWSTVRYAKHMPIYIVYPSGSVVMDGDEPRADLPAVSP